MAETTVLPHQRRNYYFLILSVVSMQLTSSTIYMVLPLFFEQYGISKTENGVLLSIGTLAGVFSGLIAGKFSDSLTTDNPPLTQFSAVIPTPLVKLVRA